MRANLRWITGVCFMLGCARGATVDELDATTDDAMWLGADGDASAPSIGNAGSDSGSTNGEDTSASSGELAERDAGRSSAPDGALAANGCAAALSCEQAKAQGIPNLGSIEWSKTELIASKSDAGSHFYLVGITGDSASEVVKGGIEARLKSPAGSNYDLYLYGGAEGYNSGLDTCEGPQASSSNPADAADSATQVWAAAAFGVLSDRLVTVEVRHIAGPCAAFTLELYGAKQ